MACGSVEKTLNGLLEAVRCTVHFYRNIFAVVPRSKGKLVAKMFKAIHTQESKDAAPAKARDVDATLREMRMKEATKKIVNSVEEALTYMVPFEQLTRIRTN